MRWIHWIFGRLLPEKTVLALYQAGLTEEKLRKMEPDERVTALERAGLDPYDYIYLAC